MMHDAHVQVYRALLERTIHQRARSLLQAFLEVLQALIELMLAEK